MRPRSFHRSFPTLSEAKFSVTQRKSVSDFRLEAPAKEAKERCEGDTTCRILPLISSRPSTPGVESCQIQLTALPLFLWPLS